MQTRGHSLGSLPPELGVTAEKLGRDVFNTTYYPKGEDADASRKPWVVIDAAGLRLGRLSTGGGDVPARRELWVLHPGV